MNFEDALKKLRLFLTIFLAVLAVTGCLKKPETVPPLPAAEPELSNETGNITVRLLTDAGGIEGNEFNALAWKGILSFYGDDVQNMKNRGTLYDTYAAVNPDMYLPLLYRAIDEGCDLIAVAGFAWKDAVKKAALENPGQKFLIVDEVVPGLPNLMQAVYAEHEGSYLVGAAAALKALSDGVVSPSFGFLGGLPGKVITRFQTGFVQGVLSVIPDAEFVDYYVNSWWEPGLAKIQAKKWYDSGVYAIYSAAGGSGGGTITQAREYRLAEKNVWAIGVDSDQYEEGLYYYNESAVLTSMLKRVDISLEYALEAVKNGTFRGETVTFNLAKGGVDYTATNSALDPEIIARLETVKDSIIKGNIIVAATYEGK